MGPVVGIDLGTTNTVVAVVRDGQAEALPDENGDKLLSSMVSFHPNGNVLVGRSARERRLVDAKNTIYAVKRLIGRAWDSEEVRTARSRFPFDMREGPGQAALVLARGETYTLPEISAFVLRKAKSIAEAALGSAIDRAVITVPANFNDLQRAATKVAGRVAGLDVVRILNEPTAAALAYGYGRNNNERLAVYDFGGGTFDVTLLDLSDNVFEVLATAGNTFLGGDDIDLAIAEKIADEFMKRFRYDPREEPQTFERLRAAAERVKVHLTTEASVSIDLHDVAQGSAGKPLELTFSMTRAELERLTRPIVDRTFETCAEALRLARLQPTDFDQVLLVGGSTRIPLVKQRVAEFFKRQPLGHISPDEVVAIGAAIQGNALSGDRRKTDLPAPPRLSARPAFYGEPAPAAVAGAAPRRAPPPRRAPTLGARAVGAGAGPGTQKPPRTQPFGEPPQVETVLSSVHVPETTPGLAGRGRIRTGAGLGPEAQQAQQAPQSTLHSAAESARQARAIAEEAHLPLIGLLDEPTLPRPRSAAPPGIDEPLAPPLYAPPPRPAPPAAAPKFNAIPLTSPAAFGRTAAPPARAPTAAPAPPPPAPLPPVNSEPPSVPPALAFSPPTAPAAPATLPRHPTPPTAPNWAPPPGRSFTPPPGRSFTPPPWTASGLTLEAESSLPVPDVVRTQTSPVQVAPPLLVDVTPLTLSVETVSGYCDRVIERNTPVPCQRTRAFVTASENQTQVRLRVSQGESSRFEENTLLGELELSGLRAAPRGAVTISVSFALDSDGILNVSATDVQTGRATSARVRLVGLPEAGQVNDMIARQHAHPLGLS